MFTQYIIYIYLIKFFSHGAQLAYISVLLKPNTLDNDFQIMLPPYIVLIALFGNLI